MYKTVCENWALPSFGNINEVVYKMKQLGFKSIDVKENQLEGCSISSSRSICDIVFPGQKRFEWEEVKEREY